MSRRSRLHQSCQIHTVRVLAVCTPPDHRRCFSLFLRPPPPPPPLPQRGGILYHVSAVCRELSRKIKAPPPLHPSIFLLSFSIKRSVWQFVFFSSAPSNSTITTDSFMKSVTRWWWEGGRGGGREKEKLFVWPSTLCEEVQMLYQSC